jgi:hypothetical protein
MPLVGNEHFIGESGSVSSRGTVVFRSLLIGVILILTCVVSFILMRMGYNALFACLFPALLAVVLIFAGAPKSFALFLFILSYTMVAAWRYIPSLKPGIIFDIALSALLFLMLFNTLFGRVDWKRGFNKASLISFIWLIYCLLEYFNLKSNSTDAWLIAVRWTGVYLFALIFLTPIQITSIKNLKYFVYTYSFLALFTIAWIFRQKFIGLDQTEYAWLSDPTVRTFHILPSGIRYWSFLTDAANAAVCLALSGAFFGVLFFFSEKKNEKFYFAFISILSLFASMLTGTRSHVVIPFLSILILALCSKSKKLIVWSIIIIAVVFVFFRFTNIGNSNSYVYRIRSAFHYEHDASFNLRREHHEQIRAYMKDKYFGVGLGMSEQKALKFDPNSEIAKIPTDSWLYTVFVETGLVGVVIYISLFVYFIAHGINISLHKLKNKFVRGVTIAATGCVLGILVSAYGNAILAQFPNGIVTFVLVGVIFSAEYLDDQVPLSDSEKGDAVRKESD